MFHVSVASPTQPPYSIRAPSLLKPVLSAVSTTCSTCNDICASAVCRPPISPTQARASPLQRMLQGVLQANSPWSYGVLYTSFVNYIGMETEVDLIPQSSNSRTRAPFKPQKAGRGTSSWQLKEYAEATLGSGSLKKAVKLPEGEDENEWLAVNGRSRPGLRTSETKGKSGRFLQPNQSVIRSHYRILLAADVSRNEGYGRVSNLNQRLRITLRQRSDSSTSGKIAKTTRSRRKCRRLNTSSI